MTKNIKNHLKNHLIDCQRLDYCPNLIRTAILNRARLEPHRTQAAIASRIFHTSTEESINLCYRVGLHPDKIGG